MSVAHADIVNREDASLLDTLFLPYITIAVTVKSVVTCSQSTWNADADSNPAGKLTGFEDDLGNSSGGCTWLNNSSPQKVVVSRS